MSASHDGPVYQCPSSSLHTAIEIERVPIIQRSRSAQVLRPIGGWPRTGLAIVYISLMMLSNLTVLAIVHERVPKVAALPDTGFLLTPREDNLLAVAECILIVETMLVGILLVVHRFRSVIIRRICLILGTLYFFRAITMAATQLPVANPDYYCSPKMPSNWSFGDKVIEIMRRVLYMSIGFGLSINGRHSFCGDYIFSGHTMILVLSYLICREYLMPARCRKWGWKLLQYGLWLASLFAVICIILSRGHYLVDIVLAYFFTTRIFWIYHTMAYNHMLRYQQPTNYLAREWWFKLFRFFEGDHLVICTGHTGAGKVRANGGRCSCCEAKFPKLPRIFDWPICGRWLSRRPPSLIQQQ